MQTSLDWRVDPRRMLQPSGLLAVAANLLPVVGVLAWGWDVFLVLVLYWFETVIVAFWTVVGIACGPRDAALFKDRSGSAWSPVGLALFFTAHSGIFLGVHFMFLWTLFAGGWPRRVDAAGGFIPVIVLHTGLWIPLLFLFASHGLSFWKRTTGRDPFQAASRVLVGEAPVVATQPETQPQPVSLGPLYARIIAMQLAIIFGGMLALALGSMAPLLILIGIKTIVDAGGVTVVEDKSAQP
jgi:hypothetical protein